MANDKDSSCESAEPTVSGVGSIYNPQPVYESTVPSAGLGTQPVEKSEIRDKEK